MFRWSVARTKNDKFSKNVQHGGTFQLFLYLNTLDACQWATFPRNTAFYYSWRTQPQILSGEHFVNVVVATILIIRLNYERINNKMMWLNLAVLCRPLYQRAYSSVSTSVIIDHWRYYSTKYLFVYYLGDQGLERLWHVATGTEPAP